MTDKFFPPLPQKRNPNELRIIEVEVKVFFFLVFEALHQAVERIVIVFFRKETNVLPVISLIFFIYNMLIIFLYFCICIVKTIKLSSTGIQK
jgi:hypothetical protein